MKFNSSHVETKDEELEVGKNYIYKESLPNTLFLFRLDNIQNGHPDPMRGKNWVTLGITVLKSIYKEEEGSETTLGFRDGEHLYHAGMWRIYDEGRYTI